MDDFVAALAFVNQVGDVAEEMQHHPDIDIRWNKVTLMVSTHSEAGSPSSTSSSRCARTRSTPPEVAGPRTAA